MSMKHLSENTKRRDHPVDPEVDEKTILKWFLEGYDVKERTILSCFCIGFCCWIL
jgi:hypothetical protein